MTILDTLHRAFASPCGECGRPAHDPGDCERCGCGEEAADARMRRLGAPSLFDVEAA